MACSRTLVGLGGSGGGAGLDWIYKEIYQVDNIVIRDHFVIYSDSLNSLTRVDPVEDEVLVVEDIIGKDVLEIATWCNTVRSGAINAHFYGDIQILKHDEDNTIVTVGHELTNGGWRWSIDEYVPNSRIYLSSVSNFFTLYIEPHTGRIYFRRIRDITTAIFPTLQSIVIRGA